MDICWRHNCLGVQPGMRLFPFYFLCLFSYACYDLFRETTPAAAAAAAVNAGPRLQTHLSATREIVIYAQVG